ESVRQAVTGNRFYRALEHVPGQVTRHELKLYASQTLLSADHRSTQLVVTAIPVPGKVPLYLEDEVAPDIDHNIALLVSEMSGGPCLGYAPCVGARNPDVERIVELAECLF